MRSLRLLEIAGRAEVIRLKREAKGFAYRTALQAIAGIFGLVVLALLHVAGWLWLVRDFSPLVATLIVAGADLLVMIVLLLLARKRDDQVARTALAIRDQSFQNALESLPLAGLISRRQPGRRR